MNTAINIWSIRVVLLILAASSIYKWGIPAYTKYLKPEKTSLNIPTTVVKKGDFKVSFHQNGTLEAKISVPVLSSIRGKLIDLADEGLYVKAGTKIAELDTEDIERDIRNAKLKYENSQADVKRVQADFELFKEQNRTDITRVQTTLDFSKAELDQVRERRDRKLKLVKEKLIAAVEVEQLDSLVREKELNVKTDEMKLILKQKEVQAAESQKASDIRASEYRSNMSKSDLEDAEYRMKEAIIKAPADGTVILSKVRDEGGNGRRTIREGDNVSPRRTICQLPDLRTMQIKVPVTESSLPRVTLDMPVLITLEAENNKKYHGIVSKIANLATEEDPRTGNSNPSGLRNFTVTVMINESDPKTLKPGMTADVEFLEKSIDNAIYVPIKAVFEKQGKTCVYIKSDDKFMNVPVETGANNGSFVCIVEGLKKGDVVALRDPESIVYEDTPKSKGKKDTKPVPIPGSQD
ncbi:MAG: efflux RND transporter periplasmic adaptor subunit [Armatimonadota bacterium]